MAQELLDTDEIDVAFSFLRADGTEGDIDLSDPPTLESSDPSAATGVLAADAKSAVIRSGDNLPANKAVTFTLKGIDVDLGKGVKTIDLAFDMLIKSSSAGQVSTANATFGTARPKS